MGYTGIVPIRLPMSEECTSSPTAVTVPIYLIAKAGGKLGLLGVVPTGSRCFQPGLGATAATSMADLARFWMLCRAFFNL